MLWGILWRQCCKIRKRMTDKKKKKGENNLKISQKIKNNNKKTVTGNRK